MNALNVNSQIIWQDNFSNPNNWIINNSSSQGGTVLGWNFNNISSLGSFSHAVVPNIGGGFVEAFYSGSGAGVGDDIKVTTSSNINLSGHPSVILEWDEVTTYHSQDPLQPWGYNYPMSFQLRVSSNNGISWSVVDLTNTIFSSNPGHRIINISQYCGNQSNVKIQFRILGFHLNDNNNFFSWGIDNVKIRKLLSNDLNLEGVEYRMLTSNGNIPRSYTSIPISQIKPFKSASKITNYGSVIQNANLNCSFNSNNYLSNNSSLSSLSSSVFTTSNTIPTPSIQGSYSISSTANSNLVEAFPQDNSITKSFQISESIYGRDSQFLYSWFQSHYGQLQESGYGQIFEINADTYVRNIQVYIPNDPTIVNSKLYGALYTYNSINNQVVKIGQSSSFTINSSHLASYVNIPLINQVLMLSGQEYVVAALEILNGAQQPKRVFAFSESTLSSNSVTVAVDNNIDFVGNTAFLGMNPMIRMQICQPSFNLLNVSACESFTLSSGQVINSSGVYVDTLLNLFGCDSIVTYNVTIHQPQITNNSISTCDFPYNWNGQLFNSPGSYSQVLQDIHGCDSTVYLNLDYLNVLPSQDICIVGHDVTSGKNKIVWEKEATQGISAYNIYRENIQSGSFDFIGSTLYNDSSLFLDQNSNPIQQAYRYNIRYIDTCGNESNMGSTHKTIHLTINQGVGNSWNLIWTPYEGLSYSSYSVYKGSSPNNMTLLSTLPSNLTSYTDASSTTQFVYYQIEIEIPNSCIPSKQLYNNSRSNVSTNDPNYTGLNEHLNLFTSIFPNPTNDAINISFDGTINQVEILDMQGKIVYSTLEDQKFISLPKDLSSGFYIISIQTPEGLFKKELVINR